VTARVEVESVGDILEISDRVNGGDINVLSRNNSVGKVPPIGN
jgi:hypothetical protein